ncbi:uncharacterized protein LOC106173591 [Lingula anatina]|uniref:Uncharacterized protein LOC106173591 n=1 Tax=Lingula anatina TaxID=7574 RepID=A0A1S3JJY0_LINAN|nr:uncharacterized protein LOC106173591 [Lingula anatina]|eukprot:XP_013410213.1 uncharacterized protein LOC106173591 [Lingula anatina]
MKVLILVALVAVATANPAERLVRSLAEDEVMKRGFMNDVVQAICIPVMDSVIGMVNGGCAALAASAEQKCKELAEKYVGNVVSGLFSKAIENMCKNLADIVIKECEKGTVQNYASGVCATLANKIG